MPENPTSIGAHLWVFVFKLNFVKVKVQMAHLINKALNSIPSGCRDLVEFAFFCGVGFTFGSLGLIWHQLIKQ